MDIGINNHSRLITIIMDAGPMVKGVLLTLFIFSVVSWAIIIYKYLLIRKAEKETVAFYDLFWQKRQFQAINAASKGFNSTPLVPLFAAAFNELANIKKSDDGSIHKDDIERLGRILRKTCTVETAKLEHTVGFLATTGNAAPFIGLFGTVWGIMESFDSIGAKGAANLAVVAPGISEALVATAMGLLAAIPAVIGYNFLITRINRISSEMENFSSDLINIADKQSAHKHPAQAKD